MSAWVNILKEENRLKEIRESLQMITGQKVVATKAKKAIAGFKTRAGLEVGMRVTLRGRADVAVPGSVDPCGPCLACVTSRASPARRWTAMAISPSAVKEHMVFPEIIPEKVQTLC
jgi:large subunit ribosomal protein L5